MRPFPRKAHVVSKSGLKVLDVLQVIGVSPKPLGLSEIVAALDLDKTTASRMLGTLTKRGFINRHPVSKKYLIGAEFLAVSSAVTSRSELLRITGPTLSNLCELTGETVSFHVRMGRKIVRLNTMERFPPDLERQNLGASVPMFAGTAGTVVMAFLPPEALNEVIADAVTAGLDESRIMTQCSFVRSNGYLTAVSELKPDMGAVAAPLFSNGKVVGSISIVGPLERMSEARRREIGLLLKDRAEELSVTGSFAEAYTYQD